MYAHIHTTHRHPTDTHATHTYANTHTLTYSHTTHMHMQIPTTTDPHTYTHNTYKYICREINRKKEGNLTAMELQLTHGVAQVHGGDSKGRGEDAGEGGRRRSSLTVIGGVLGCSNGDGWLL